MTQTAPLHHVLADGPPGGRAAWLHAADGVRLRAAHWPAQGKGRGTVLLLPGRSEYAEKYGRAAAHLARRGYDTLALDFRGQGLADRLLPDRRVGHVGDFAEYQLDVRALVALADGWGLPGPRFLLCHSMGGTIALRALIEGLAVSACAFTAPMWGIRIAPSLRPLAIALAGMSRLARREAQFVPTTGPGTYVLDFPFRNNMLTTDPEMWDWMASHLLACPELALGGPSLGWLHAALTECRRLAPLPSPDLPTLCALGTAERIIEAAPIRRRMAHWPTGRLDLYPGAEHEVLMETPTHRNRFLDSVCDLFDSHRGPRGSEGDLGEAIPQRA